MKKITLLLFTLCALAASAQKDSHVEQFYIGEDMHELRLYMGSENQLWIKGEDPTDSILLYGFSEDNVKYAIAHAKLKHDAKLEQDHIEKIYKSFENYYYEPKIVITGNGLANFISTEKKAFDVAATAGFGISFSKNNGKQLGITGTITETRDTILSIDKRDFGRAILVPGIRKFSVMINYRSLNFFKNNWGYGIFANMTPMVWKTYTAMKHDSTEMDSLPSVKHVTPITGEVYFSYTIYNNTNTLKKITNPTRITFDLGLVYKYLGEDQLTDIERENFLGSSQDNFFGFLFGIDVRSSGMHFYVYTTYIPSLGRNSHSIPGLTDLQATGAIGLAVNIADLSGALRK